MSVQTLYTAATGMEALQTKLEVIANNLANVNTTAFKKDRCNFEDLFYRNDTFPGATDTANNMTALGIHVGLGSRVESVQSNFTQGAFQQTSGPLDVAIEGIGFLQVTQPDGTIAYTRAGNLSINANGNVVLGSAQTGRQLEPSIQIPQGTTNITITADGQVQGRAPNTTTLTTLGTLQLAQFVNQEGLLKLGENLYQQTDASGQPQTGNPNQQGFGMIRQGWLEASNVEPVQELIDLITTQRSFELNSQTVQAGDQILQLISNLRR